MFYGNGVIRLGGNPELKFLPNGDPVVTFSAVIEQFKKGGEEQVIWGRFKAFGDTARTLNNYLKVGHLLQVTEASLRPQKFETRDGVKVETFDFVIRSFKFLPNKKKEGGEPNGNESRENPEAPKPPVEDSDDVPF